MFLFDVETLGIESTSVILSAAITYFDFDQKKYYQDYVNDSCFVKFDRAEQERLGRVVTPSTLEWWEKQAEIPRKVSLEPSKDDLSAVEGIERMRSYINANGGANQIIWARGSLDQMAIDSLCRAVDIEPLTRYNNWRDVRTAIDFLSNTASNGYCKIKNFNPDLFVVKHDPRNDCALDILMLTQYED